MAKPKNKTRPEDIIAGVALLAAGYDGKRMSRYLNLAGWQLKEVESIKAKAIANLSSDNALMDVMKNELAKGLLIHAKASLIQSAEVLPEASALQAATVMGISIDKHLALTGKLPPPAPQLHLHTHVSSELDRIEKSIKDITGDSSDITEGEIIKP